MPQSCSSWQTRGESKSELGADHDANIYIMLLRQHLCSPVGAAWLDYISPHDIDFKQSLSCICPDKHGIVTRLGADGIMLGCQAQLVTVLFCHHQDSAP